MRAIIVILFTVICSGCSDTDCSNDVIEELSSPSGEMKIILFSRNCGATTGFNTHAMILNKYEEMPKKSGNTFIIDRGTSKVVWKSEGEILVVFGHGTRVFKQKSSVRGIAIEYQKL